MEYVTDLLGTADPFTWIDALPEHGHIWYTLQGNYIDSKGVDITRVTNALSESDVFDTSIYSGQWSLLP